MRWSLTLVNIEHSGCTRDLRRITIIDRQTDRQTDTHTHTGALNRIAVTAPCTLKRQGADTVRGAPEGPQPRERGAFVQVRGLAASGSPQRTRLECTSTFAYQSVVATSGKVRFVRTARKRSLHPNQYDLSRTRNPDARHHVDRTIVQVSARPARYLYPAAASHRFITRRYLCIRTLNATSSQKLPCTASLRSCAPGYLPTYHSYPVTALNPCFRLVWVRCCCPFWQEASPIPNICSI